MAPSSNFPVPVFLTSAHIDLARACKFSQGELRDCQPPQALPQSWALAESLGSRMGALWNMNRFPQILGVAFRWTESKSNKVILSVFPSKRIPLQFNGFQRFNLRTMLLALVLSAASACFGPAPHSAWTSPPALSIWHVFKETWLGRGWAGVGG